MSECKKCSRLLDESFLFCPYCGASQAAWTRSRQSRGRGQGSVYKLPNGHYRAVVTLGYYVDADGKQHRKTASKEFVKKCDAIASIPELKQQTVQVKDMTLMQLHDIYLESADYKTIGDSQKDKLSYAWTRLGDIWFRPIGTLTIAEMEECIYAQTDTYYPARDMKVMLSHLYTIAIKHEIVQYNKTEYIDLPDPPTAKRESWTQDEVEAMWRDYEEHPYTGYPLIMCYTGMRYGELATLLIDNIFLEQRYMIGGEKTEAGRNREIPIHHRILPVIQRLMLGRKTKLLEMNEDHWRQEYWNMVARTKIRELKPQTCRHFWFSSMVAAGVQGGIVAETGGHTDFATTMRNYVRIPLADKLKAVETVK